MWRRTPSTVNAIATWRATTYARRPAPVTGGAPSLGDGGAPPATESEMHMPYRMGDYVRITAHPQVYEHVHGKLALVLSAQPVGTMYPPELGEGLWLKVDGVHFLQALPAVGVEPADPGPINPGSNVKPPYPGGS
jgi:hypothetical protein